MGVGESWEYGGGSHGVRIRLLWGDGRGGHGCGWGTWRVGEICLGMGQKSVGGKEGHHWPQLVD